MKHTFYAHISTVFDVHEHRGKPPWHQFTIPVSPRGFDVDDVNDMVGICVQAGDVLARKFDAMENGDAIERDVEDRGGFLHLRFRVRRMLILHYEPCKSQFELRSTILIAQRIE